MNDPVYFSAQHVADAQRQLRVALGLPPLRLEIGPFLSRLGDEITQMRAAHRGDADIAAVIAAATGMRVDAAAIARYGPHAAGTDNGADPALDESDRVEPPDISTSPDRLNAENDG